MFTSYEDTVAYLFQRFPAFQTNGGSAYKPGLERVFQLCELLGNPQNQFKSVHVAGTNGKGSVCSSLASIYIEAGYKVGLYTSPHMIDFRERVRINGEMISKDEVVDFVNTHLDPFQEIDPSFFEWSTGLAFEYFAKNKVDIAIIETGLGGRLDATNVITPQISVITSIGIDHIGYLGNTLVQIASEKAGIIKEGVPVVIGELGDVSVEVVKEIAEAKKSELLVATDSPEYQTALIGRHQNQNKNVALTVVKALQNQFPVSTNSIQNGLMNILKNSGLRGRREVLQDNPMIIADIAHNVQAMTALVDSLEDEKYNQLHIVIGMVDDKEISDVVSLLPEAKIYCCKPDNKRGLDAEKLLEIVKENSKSTFITAYSSCGLAFVEANKKMKASDILLVTGSNFVVSEILRDFF